MKRSTKTLKAVRDAAYYVSIEWIFPSRSLLVHDHTTRAL